MSDNVLCRAPGVLNLEKAKAWESSQTFGGADKRSPLGAFYGDLNCGLISEDDRLLLCQIGTDAGHPTVNGFEIARVGQHLVINTYVEAAGGYQDIVCRQASGKNIKVSVKPELKSGGKYDRVRFMIYDADIPDFYEAMFIRTYNLPSPQGIDRVAMMLRPCGEYGDDYRPCGIPVGVDNFHAFGPGRMPAILKPGFEWSGEEVRRKNGRIVSRHCEIYKINSLVSLRQWKEKA